MNNKLGNLNTKIEELNTALSEKESNLNELKKDLEEKEKELGEQKSKLEKAETELNSMKPVQPTEYTSEERLICPSCGSVGKDIKAEEDKSKVLGYIGHSPMYGKKNVCKKCGYSFQYILSKTRELP